MKRVYALAMEAPSRYVVGQSSASPEAVISLGHVSLTDPAHLMVLKGQSVLTPIDVLDNFHAKVTSYVGFGELNEEYTQVYLAWLEMRRNPPDFEVQEEE